MADELGKKKPELGAGSSPMPAPKQASTPKPAPMTTAKPAPAPKAGGFSAPKQPKPAAPAAQKQPQPKQVAPTPKLKQPTVDPVRKKITDQGFKPNFKLNHIESKEKPEAWSVGNYDSYLNEDGSLAVHFDGKHVGNFKNRQDAEDFVKNDTDRQNKWLNNPSESQDGSEESNYVKNLMKNRFEGEEIDDDLMMEAYKQADNENGFDNMWSENDVAEAIEGKYRELLEQKQPPKGHQGLDIDEDYERSWGPAQEDGPKNGKFYTRDDIEDLDEETNETGWNNDNNPGSGVVTKELTDFVRDYLSKDGELSPEFIDKTVNNLSSDHNKADFYKGKMKEAYERGKASELFGTDLNDTPQNKFKSNKEEAKKLIDQMPFDEQSAKSFKNVIDQCNNPQELFWNFFFNFLDSDIQQELSTKYPKIKEALDKLGESNKELWNNKDNIWSNMEDDYEEEPSESYAGTIENPEDYDRYKSIGSEPDPDGKYSGYDESDVGKKWRH